jgi:putative transposase
MPRPRRSFVEGLSLHLHQRGNNRAAIFHDNQDRFVFLLALLWASRKYEVAIHVWVLMNNHFHLLATPSTPTSVPQMMQQIGRSYVPYFNKRHERTGGLWGGRYSGHLVDTDLYWLRCARYIELNPVRASLVATPGEYRWSSYRANGCGAEDKLVTPHRLYIIESGSDSLERQAAYRGLCVAGLSELELTSIRKALRTGRSGADLPDATSLAVAS